MYLRETTRKNRDGTKVTYYQIAENEWDPLRGRAKPRILCNLGRADANNRDRLQRLARSILRRCDPEQLAAEDEHVQHLDSWPHGALYVLEAMWDRLGIRGILQRQAKAEDREIPLERALFAMVANRCIKPASKLGCWQRWLKDEIYFPDGVEIELHHLYRAMDFLERHQEPVEREVYFSVADLLSLDVDLIFYDTTSVHFEIEEPDDETREFHGQVQPPLRKRGHSKNRRTDVPQIVIGMAVTRDGLPVRSWVFPGNTADRSTIQQVKSELNEWKLSRCIFVSDAGTASEKNFKTLSAGGGKYIMCVPAKLGDEVTEEVLSKAGRYKPIAENLQIKEVWIPKEGERRRRYVVCYNPEEALRRRRKREDILNALTAELEALGRREEAHPSKACDLMASPQYRPYLKTLKSGRLAIDRSRVKAEERFDGKWVVRSNDDSLSAEDIALGYKQLMTVENGWRDLKSLLDLRPVYHSSPHRIKAHVTICMLALLLQRAIERACGATWSVVRHDLDRIKVAQLLTPDGEIIQRTPINDESYKHLSHLKLEPPSELLTAK